MPLGKVDKETQSNELSQTRLLVSTDGGTTWVAVKGNASGSLVMGGNLVTADYDYIAITYPTASSEVYTFKTGGSGGTTIATVSVVYTDSTKENVSTVTKS